MNPISVNRFLVFAGCILGMAAASELSGQDAGYANKKMVYPDQGWSAEDRLRYYNTSQGSAALWYDIFLNLENAENQELFRSDATMRGYGLVPQSPDPIYNPDGLPIGVTKTSVSGGRWTGDWVGLTCAACHDAELEYKGTTIKISGGNNKDVDFHALIQGLDDALTATLADGDKFGRLAQRMGAMDESARAALRDRVEANGLSVSTYNEYVAATPSVVGPGRTDALRLIHNQVQSNWMEVPQNWVAPLAPAKPSFVWNIPQSAWAQWSGVVFDPLERNGA